ncbi:hypothetical protein C8J57DRAFT_1579948 [Mycena rebaudengoi]|nr:hypothetical protein C8J57DRAFT_1579948 [Mycena rebaudengoi]
MRHHFTRRICALRTLPLDTTRQVPRTAPSHAAITRTSSSTPGAPALPIAESCLTLPLAHCDTTLSRTLSHAARVLGRRHPLATHTRARTRLDGRQPCVLRSRVPLVIHFASQRATIARARRRRVLPAGSPAHPAAILHAAAPPVHHPPTNILAYPARALHQYVPEVHVSAARHSPTSWCTTIARASASMPAGVPRAHTRCDTAHSRWRAARARARFYGLDNAGAGTTHDLVSQSSLEGACLRHASVPPARRYIRPPLVRSHAARLRARMSNGLRSSSPVNNVRSPSASRVDEEVYVARPALGSRAQRFLPYSPAAALYARAGAERTQHTSPRPRAQAATAPPRPSRAAFDPLPHAPHASPPTDRARTVFRESRAISQRTPHARPFRPRRVTHPAHFCAPRRVRAPSCHRPAAPFASSARSPSARTARFSSHGPRSSLSSANPARSPSDDEIPLPGTYGLPQEKVAVRVGAMPAYLLCASSAVSCTTHCGPIAVFSEHRESPSASLMGDVVPT